MQTDATLTTDRSLNGIALLQGLSAEALSAIESQCRWVELKPGAAEGESAEGGETFFVVSGTASVVSKGADGSSVELGNVGAGQMFGALSAHGGARAVASAAGEAPCLVGALSGDVFRAVLIKFPKLALRLAEQLSAAIQAGGGARGGGGAPRQRIYGYLISLAVPNPAGDGSWVIENPPNHDEIAAQAGIEKQDVAMVIGALARDGVVERKHRKLVVRDHPRLRMMASM